VVTSTALTETISISLPWRRRRENPAEQKCDHRQCDGRQEFVPVLKPYGQHVEDRGTCRDSKEDQQGNAGQARSSADLVGNQARQQ